MLLYTVITSINNLNINLYSLLIFIINVYQVNKHFQIVYDKHSTTIIMIIFLYESVLYFKILVLPDGIEITNAPARSSHAGRNAPIRSGVKRE